MEKIKFLLMGVLLISLFGCDNRARIYIPQPPQSSQTLYDGTEEEEKPLVQVTTDNFMMVKAIFDGAGDYVINLGNRERGVDSPARHNYRRTERHEWGDGGNSQAKKLSQDVGDAGRRGLTRHEQDRKPVQEKK